MTSKPEVTPLAVSSLPGDQPYMSLGPMITVTLPKLFLKLLHIEQAIKFQTWSSKINMSQSLVEIQEPLWCSPEANWIPRCGNRYRTVLPSDRVIAHCSATRFSACTWRAGSLRHHSEALPKDSSKSTEQDRSFSLQRGIHYCSEKSSLSMKEDPPHLLKSPSIMGMPRNIRQGCHKSLWKPQELKIARHFPP